MIRPALVLTLSGYGWYLVLTHSYPPGLPIYGSGLAGLIFVALVPLLLGFAAGKTTIDAGPTIFRLILIVFLQYLAYAVLVALGGAVYESSFPVSFAGPFIWTSLIPPAVGQLFCWAGGTYAAVMPPQPAAREYLVHLRAVETSLLVMIPVVFLLTFMDYPAALILLLTGGWFIALAFTLALAGGGADGRSIIRHDLIFLHILVPLVATTVLFFLAFSQEAHLFLQAARDGLGTALSFLFYLLGLLLRPKTDGGDMIWETGDQVFPTPSEPFMPERTPPPWLFLPFLIAAIPALYAALQALLQLLRTRLKPSPATVRRFSLWKSFNRACRWLVTLMQTLFHQSLTLIKIMFRFWHRTGLKIAKVMRAMLPAQTPHQEIIRSYKRFLRWGRRRGCSYRPSETPFEYSLRLQNTARKRTLPGTEIDRFTALFLEARYSRHPACRRQSAACTALLKTIVKGTKTKKL